ncbi:DUF4271 domain-containing protein [Butyricimonas hominis]|uniref:DUF4271 domain-containing protein n=1 Tax=Butyricimonas hominis TaxID=2763032 RepID=A0ABR7CWN1_9BACT|nr:DUF4271 domain-containing protein [Butyricimonas hominis]MBC5620087.1 DUF4271 domain-containing protein [Butyricimonas hominis]
MLEQVADSVVRDSSVFPAFLLEESVSRMPAPPMDTLTNYIGLVDATPLEGWDFHLTTGILTYMVVFLVLVALLRLQGRGFLLAVYFYFFSRKRDVALISEGTRQNYSFVLLSICLSFSSLAMLIAFMTSEPFVFSNALFYFLIIFGYYIVLLGTVRLLGWTFNSRHCASDIILNLRVSGIVLGLSVSPLVLALFFVKSSAVTTLFHVIFALFVILLIFRFIRLIKILYGYKVSILYMILYLCGLEIVPMLVLYKLLV